MKILTLHHLKIPYNGENKRQRKDKTEKMENQNEAAYQATKVQHRNSSHKRHRIMNYLHAQNVMVPTSLQLKPKKGSW